MTFMARNRQMAFVAIVQSSLPAKAIKVRLLASLRRENEQGRSPGQIERWSVLSVARQL